MEYNTIPILTTLLLISGLFNFILFLVIIRSKKEHKRELLIADQEHKEQFQTQFSKYHEKDKELAELKKLYTNAANELGEAKELHKINEEVYNELKASKETLSTACTDLGRQLKTQTDLVAEKDKELVNWQNGALELNRKLSFRHNSVYFSYLQLVLKNEFDVILRSVVVPIDFAFEFEDSWYRFSRSSTKNFLLLKGKFPSHLETIVEDVPFKSVKTRIHILGGSFKQVDKQARLKFIDDLINVCLDKFNEYKKP